MAFFVEENKAPNPVDICTFCANAVVFEANGMTNEVEEFGLVIY
jgi:hypothetical protein